MPRHEPKGSHVSCSLHNALNSHWALRFVERSKPSSARTSLSRYRAGLAARFRGCDKRDERRQKSFRDACLYAVLPVEGVTVLRFSWRLRDGQKSFERLAD